MFIKTTKSYCILKLWVITDLVWLRLLFEQEHEFVSLLIIKPTCVIIHLASPQVLLVDGRIDTVQSSCHWWRGHPLRKYPHPFFYHGTFPSVSFVVFFFLPKGQRRDVRVDGASGRSSCVSSVMCADATPVPRPSCTPMGNAALPTIHSPMPMHTRSLLRFTCLHTRGDRSQSPALPTDARRGGVCRPQTPTWWPTAAESSVHKPPPQLQHVLPRSTFETCMWNNFNIRLKEMKHIKHMLETCAYSHSNIYNILI
jgi:hypothetical protein